MIFNKMRAAVAAIVTQIHQHPFNQELAQGTLAKEKFIFYLIQDACYLAEFSRALAQVAARLSNHHHAQQFMQFSLDASKAERDLHLNYLKENKALVDLSTVQSPACFMYSNYLLKMASLDAIEEAVASLLPCFWVYREVAKNILVQQCLNNPYQAWIALYASDAFDESVNAAVNITNELANTATVVTQEKMITAFVRSTQLEWLFWDSAYHQQQWLIGT